MVTVKMAPPFSVMQGFHPDGGLPRTNRSKDCNTSLRIYAHLSHSSPW